MRKVWSWLRTASPRAVVGAGDRVFALREAEVWWWTAILRVAAAVALVSRAQIPGDEIGTTALGVGWCVIGIGLGMYALWRSHPTRDPMPDWTEAPSFLIALLATVGGEFVAGGLLLLAAIPFTAYLLEFRLNPRNGRRSLFTLILALLASYLGAIPALLHEDQPSKLVYGTFLAAGATTWIVLAVSRRRWRLYFDTAQYSMHVVQLMRVDVSDRTQRLIHDGLIGLLEQGAAGQPFDEGGRHRAQMLARFAREVILEDKTPRSIAALLDSAREQAAIVGVRLLTVQNIEGEPPGSVIRLFDDALGALIANLKHANTDEATLTVDAGESWLSVTLSDAGIGRESGLPWSKSVNERVVDQLNQFGATAIVESAPGAGVTWQLEWGNL